MKKIVLAIAIAVLLIGLIGTASAGYSCVKDQETLTAEDCCNTPITGNVFDNDYIPENYKNIRTPTPGVVTAVGNGVGTIVFDQDGNYEFTPTANLPYTKKGIINYLIKRDDGIGLPLGAYVQFEVPAGCNCSEPEEPYDPGPELECSMIEVQLTGIEDGQTFNTGDTVRIGTIASFNEGGCYITKLEVNGKASGSRVTFSMPGTYIIREIASTCDGSCKTSDTITVTAQ